MPIVDNFNRGFGLRREAPDRRDRALFAAQVNIDALPKKASCAKHLPKPMDQELTNSCVGFSGATLLSVVLKKDQHIKPFVPSPVWLYRQAREIGGNLPEDSGAEIRNMWKAANRTGIVPISSLKPKFDSNSLAKANPDGVSIFPEKSVWRRQPAGEVMEEAQHYQAIQYFKLFNLGDFLKCIANGWPVQAGIEIYRSFYGTSGPKYVIPEPKQKPNDYSLGFHAVVAYEYDMRSRTVLWRNSWGRFPHEGKPDFVTSFNFIEPYVTDAWTCRLVEGGVLSPIK